MDPSLGGSGWKKTTTRDLEYFMHTKFHQNPSSGSGKVENVNCLTDDGRTDRQCVITIGHWSLRLLCPKNCWPVNSALLTCGNVTNDVMKRHISWRQRRASAYCWQCFGDLKLLGNKAVISRLLGGQSNHNPSVVEKIWETVALGLPKSSPLPRDNNFYCPPRSHEIPVYMYYYCPFSFFHFSIKRNRKHWNLNILL